MFFILRILWSESAADHLFLTLPERESHHILWDACVDIHVINIDEWVETGSQINAAIKLIEAQDGIVVGIASINMDENRNTAKIRENYRVHTVWEAEHPLAKGEEAYR